MGLDTVICFRVKPDFDTGDLGDRLPAGFTLRSVPDYHARMYPDATHDIDTYARYYGEGYERGPWPQIAATLMSLFATEGVERVWYGDDCSGAKEIGPECVLELSAHYMKHGRRPYLGTFRPPTK